MVIRELTIVCDGSNFKIFNVATSFTPAMVIENVLSGKAEPKGWAITEVVEKGDGAWAKVRLAFQLPHRSVDRILLTIILLPIGNNHRVRW